METLTITFSGSRIIAIGHENFVQRVCAEYLQEDERLLIAGAPDDVRRRLIAAIRREGSFGRSQFHIAFEESPRGLEVCELVIEQKLFLVENGPEGWQRVADGLIEISALAVRVRLALDDVVDTLLASRQAGTTDFHEGMYH